MNVLILYENEIIPEKGGVQRVTFVLFEYLRKNYNYNVSYLSTRVKSGNSSKFQFFLPTANNITQNKLFFEELLSERNISIVINQSGTNPLISKYLSVPVKKNIPIVSSIHTSLLTGINNFSTLYENIIKPKIILKILTNTPLRFLIKYLYRLKYFKHYTNIFRVSSMVIALSESLIPELKFITKNKFNNLQSISNPLTINQNLKVSKKNNKILYVGRIDNTYKRVDLLVDIWGKISNNHPNWEFNILGDGPYFDELKNRIKNENISNLNLLGSINPTKSYETASILCLTSSSESFGLVILEAFSYEIIPILFNSFPLAKEIVSDEKDGLLIPPFDIGLYAEKLNYLILNEELRLSLSKASKEKLKKFKLEDISDKWINLIESVVNENKL